MNNSIGRLKIIAGLVVVIGLVAGGIGYYWWTGTPQYSMQQLHTAVMNHNVDGAFKYIDFDSVFDNLWSDVSAQAMQKIQQEDTSNPFASLGAAIGMGMLDSMKPTVKTQLHDQIESAIRGDSTTEASTTVATAGASTSSSTVGFSTITSNNYKLVTNGASVYVAFDSGVKFYLKQTPQRYWQIVKIETPATK